VEGNGYVSMEAVHYSHRIVGTSAQWEQVDDLGRTLSAMTLFPVNSESMLPGPGSPRLEYDMYLFHPGQVKVDAIVDPTLNFVPGRGLRYAVSFDDEKPQIIDVLAGDNREKWETSVKDSVRIGRSTHTIAKPGYHTLKIWMVDPGIVLQKLVIDLGGVKPSYLGPPESYRYGSESNSRGESY
jgi:Gylcosyl hydrolase family 115 C-terminal domain